MAMRKFEDALKRLEEIVAELEQGDLPMEASLKIFEEGVRLSKQCMRTLEDAERKVHVLLQEGDGKTNHRPVESEDDSVEGSETVNVDVNQ